MILAGSQWVLVCKGAECETHGLVYTLKLCVYKSWLMCVVWGRGAG